MLDDLIPSIAEASQPELRAMMDPEQAIKLKNMLQIITTHLDTLGWYKPVVEPLIHFLQQEYATNLRNDRYPYVLVEFIRRHSNALQSEGHISYGITSCGAKTEPHIIPCISQTLCLFLAFEAQPLLDPFARSDRSMQRLGELILLKKDDFADLDKLEENIRQLISPPVKRDVDPTFLEVVNDDRFVAEAVRQFRILHSSDPAYVTSDVDDQRFTQASAHTAYHVLVHHLLKFSSELLVRAKTNIPGSTPPQTTAVILDESRYPNLVYITLDSGTPVLGHSVVCVQPMDTVSSSVIALWEKSKKTPKEEGDISLETIKAVFNKVSIDANKLYWAEDTISKRGSTLDVVIQKLRPKILSLIGTISIIQTRCSSLLISDLEMNTMISKLIHQINKDHHRINIKGARVKGNMTLTLNKIVSKKNKKSIKDDEKINQILNEMSLTQNYVRDIASEFKRVFYRIKAVNADRPAASTEPAAIAATFEEYVRETASANKETTIEIDPTYTDDQTENELLLKLRQQKIYSTIVKTCHHVLKAFANVFAERNFSSLYEAINFVAIKDAYKIMVVNHLSGDLFLWRDELLSHEILNLAKDLMHITHEHFAEFVICLWDIGAKLSASVTAREKVFKLTRNIMMYASLSKDEAAVKNLLTTSLYTDLLADLYELGKEDPKLKALTDHLVATKSKI